MTTPPALVVPESLEDGDDVSEAVDGPEDVFPGTEVPEPVESPPSLETREDKNLDVPDDKADGRSGRRRARERRRSESTPPPSPALIIPRVRKTNYDGFKNYYNEEESHFAIEVLEAGYNIKEEVARERQKRGRGFKIVALPSSTARGGTTTDEIWIQRVRIQSEFILAHLRSIMGVNFRWDKPRTFFRPFHAFLHFQPKAKEALEKLRKDLAQKKLDSESHGNDTEKGEGADEDKNAKGGRRKQRKRSRTHRRNNSRSDNSDDDSSSGSGSGSGSDTDEAAEIPEELLLSQDALDHLQCYVDFVDKNIMHLQDLFKGTSRQRIRYSDLTYLFHPGDTVYSPTQAEIVGSANYTATKPSAAVYQPLWKVQYINPPSISDVHPEEYDKYHRFYISCFYIDFDGKSYGPVKHSFDVSPYEGEIDIKNLPVYPLRYHTTSGKGASIQGPDRLRPAAKDFQYFVEEKHLYYRGWTLTTSPNGDVLTDSAGESMKHPEHIDSNVIVDFTAALQALPSWKPTFKEPSRMSDEWNASTDDAVPVLLWSDSKMVRRIVETTQLRDGAHAAIANKFFDTDPFLVAYMAGNTDVNYELSADDLQLLPGRVMAYVLRDRKFVQLDVHYLSKIEKQSNVFENLKIAEHHKEMVMALVDSHFRKKNFKTPRHFSLGQDLIQGKGEGLVILLHGVPGVGKTATAEAVAQSNQQPLFVITCGDLGFTPKEVERSLEEIFRLAHLWDCILLLDEADIFLAERTRDDLKRNALVSVFLRVLEYYSGILFLTTNRVGTLDEAFKSRIHMSLYYPPLDRQQTLQIFEMNIGRIEEIGAKRQAAKLAAEEHSKAVNSKAEKKTEAKEQKDDPPPDLDDFAHDLVVDRDKVMDFAQWHFDAHEKGGRWNGRQIRNAFQIASSLAFYDKRQAWIQRQAVDKSAEIGAAVLSDEQFRKVARATLRFERYMTDARGGDDKHQARLDRLRADDHVTQETEPQPYSHRGDRQLQLRRPDDDNYKGSRMFGTPPSPAPRTPQSGRRGGDDYGRRRAGPGAYEDGRYSESRYDSGRNYGSDRDRDWDRDRDRDRDRDHDRDRDYQDGSAGRSQGAAQDPRRRNYGGDYDSSYSPRPNGGYDRERERERDRRYDRDDSYYDRNRGRDDRPPTRSSGGRAVSGDFRRPRSRDRTPTRSDRLVSSYYDDAPAEREGGRGGDVGSERKPGQGPDDDYDLPPPPSSRYRDSSYQSPPPSGTPGSRIREQRYP